MPKGELK